MPPDVPILFSGSEFDPPERRAASLTDHLSGTSLGPVRWVAQTGSTNADLMAAVSQGATAGMVLIADHQTAGRGRRDRTWTTAPGAALLMSVLQGSPGSPANIALAGTALGLAACEAVHAFGFAQVRIKWPNDLVVVEPTHQPKLAGVLAQSSIRGDTADVVIGIGLNVRADGLGELVTDRPTIALSELGRPPDRVALAAAILERFARIDTRESAFWARYRAHSATLDTAVRIETDHGVIDGRAVDVDPDGALVVETATGRETVVVGDVESVRTD